MCRDAVNPGLLPPLQSGGRITELSEMPHRPISGTSPAKMNLVLAAKISNPECHWVKTSSRIMGLLFREADKTRNGMVYLMLETEDTKLGSMLRCQRPNPDEPVGV